MPVSTKAVAAHTMRAGFHHKHKIWVDLRPALVPSWNKLVPSWYPVRTQLVPARSSWVPAGYEPVVPNTVRAVEPAECALWGAALGARRSGHSACVD